MNIIEQLSLKTEGYQIVNITKKVEELVHRHEFKKGLVNLSILHTSASLTVQENASKDVLNDIRAFLTNLVPEDANYLHDLEGPDDMPAHLKTLITNTNVTMSVDSNKLILGVWQGIYLCEWRKYGQTRSVIVHMLGE
ncbi:secondary thiamine-phosphate synthase enzyme YjbQ [Paracoccaceae bacterium]|nr:secondary thiamine-phosphate synthase enzyme YjbQ [Paracoccaceae bacterium]